MIYYKILLLIIMKKINNILIDYKKILFKDFKIKICKYGMIDYNKLKII